MLTELLARIRHTRQTDAASQYRDILSRRARPDPDDAAALLGILPELGITVKTVEADLAAADEIDRLRAIADTADARRNAYRTAHNALNAEAADIEAAKIELRNRALAAERADTAARVAVDEANAAVAQLGELRRRHPHLFNQ